MISEDIINDIKNIITQYAHIKKYYSYYGYTRLQIIASPLVIKFRNAPLATQELLS